MSITRTERITCACGMPLEVKIADSINPERHPHFKQALLDRTFHAFRCAACQRTVVVEKSVMYLDFERRQFFCMWPRAERAREAARAAEVKTAYEHWMMHEAPRFVVELGKTFLARVCFGYEELREKIVIDDAGLSDLVIEALKLDLMIADPWFAAADVQTLRLDVVLPDGSLRLVPEWADLPPPGVVPQTVTVRRAVYDEIDARFDEILTVHPGLAGGPHVSLLRLARPAS